MDIGRKALGLRRALCCRGLLTEYNVYEVPTDELGNSGVPALYSSVMGYIYSKNSRSTGNTVEIAGEIGGGLNGGRRMLVFSPECKISDLVEAGGVFYRITNMRVIYSIYSILDLEVYPYENQA